MNRVTVPFFISHQGCPHSCVFCDQRTISGAKGNLPTSDEILSKVRVWQLSTGGRTLEVAFFGGTFTALPIEIQERLIEPLQPLLATGEVASIRVSTRPDRIDAAQVEWLAGRGVKVIELGVQSMDDDVLEASGRGHDSAASEAAIRCVGAGGILVGAQLMPGLPGDTPQKSLRSLERAIAAGADFVRIYPVVVLAGTELARRFENGEYRPLELGQGVSICKLLLHAAMKAGVDVIRIGLQADEGLNRESVLAGCWHPAFGQLVRSEIYFDLLVHLADGLPGDAPLSISCHPSRISDVVGQGRVNLKRLREKGGAVTVKPLTSLLKEEVILECLNHNRKGHIVTDLHYKIHEV